MTTGEQPASDTDDYYYKALSDEALLINSDVQAARHTFEEIQRRLAGNDGLVSRHKRLAKAAYSSSHQPTIDRQADAAQLIINAHKAQAKALARHDRGVEDSIRHFHEYPWVYHDIAVEYAQDPNSGITNLQIGKIAVRIHHPGPAEQPTQDGVPIEVIAS